MLKIRIGEFNYEVRNTWADITIEDAANIASEKMPESLYAVYIAAYQSSGLTNEERELSVKEAQGKITHEEQFKIIPAYYGRILSLLSNVPGEILPQISSSAITTLYHQYLRNIVEGILFHPPDFKLTELNDFDFEGERYYLPVSKEIMGKKVPAINLTALEFTESADILIHLNALNKERDLLRLANLVSIICRPKGEKYDEMKCSERAEKFKRLTMDKVWSVFFSLTRYLTIPERSVQISILEKAAREGNLTNSLHLGGMGKS